MCYNFLTQSFSAKERNARFLINDLALLKIEISTSFFSLLLLSAGLNMPMLMQAVDGSTDVVVVAAAVVYFTLVTFFDPVDVNAVYTTKSRNVHRTSKMCTLHKVLKYEPNPASFMFIFSSFS